MNKFIITVILILILLVVGGGVYYSGKVEKLNDKIFTLVENSPESIFSVPNVTESIPATLSKQDGVVTPRIIYKDTGSFKRVPVLIYDTITEPFDTTAFLIDYLSLKFYIDSIQTQDVNIKIIDTLQKNSIFAREYIVKNNRTEAFYKRRMLYIGGTAGGSKEQLLIGPSLQYIDKKNNLFEIQVLFNGTTNKTFLFNYSKKITFKK